MMVLGDVGTFAGLVQEMRLVDEAARHHSRLKASGSKG